MLFWNRWNIKNRPVVFTSTILRENPLTPRHTFNRSRANSNGPIRNTYCFLLEPRAIIGLSWLLLKPIRDNLAPGFPRALDLSPLHAQKSSGSRLFYRLSNIKWRFFSYFLILFMQRFVGYTVGWFSLFKKWSTLISCISLFLAV